MYILKTFPLFWKPIPTPQFNIYCVPNFNMPLLIAGIQLVIVKLKFIIFYIATYSIYLCYFML